MEVGGALGLEGSGCVKISGVMGLFEGFAETLLAGVFTIAVSAEVFVSFPSFSKKVSITTVAAMMASRPILMFSFITMISFIQDGKFIKNHFSEKYRPGISE
jgi:hypothetical protein